MQTVGPINDCTKIGTTMAKIKVKEDVNESNSYNADSAHRAKPCRLMEDATTVSTRERVIGDFRQRDGMCVNQNISNIRSRFQQLRRPHLQGNSEVYNKLWPDSTVKNTSKTNRAPFVWTGLNSRRLIGKWKPAKVTASREKQSSDEQETSENNVLHRHSKRSPNAISAPVGYATKSANRPTETTVTNEVSTVATNATKSRRFSHSHSPLGDARQWQPNEQQDTVNTTGELTQNLVNCLANEETSASKPSSSSIWRFISQYSVGRLTTHRQVVLTSVGIRSGNQVQAAQKHRTGLEPVEQADRLIASIKVNNVAYEKSVIVRVTTDSWKTFTDHPALYLTSRSEPSADMPSIRREDTFTFQTALPRDSDRVEFAIQFIWGKPGEEPSGVDWDNNEGMNYVVVRKKLEQTEKT